MLCKLCYGALPCQSGVVCFTGQESAHDRKLGEDFFFVFFALTTVLWEALTITYHFLESGVDGSATICSDISVLYNALFRRLVQSTPPPDASIPFRDTRRLQGFRPATECERVSLLAYMMVVSICVNSLFVWHSVSFCSFVLRLSQGVTRLLPSYGPL